MPTYDYVCDGCGHAFELFQSMSDSVKRSCPECKARKLRRLIGTGAAILVGGRTSAPPPSSGESSGSDAAAATDSSSDDGTTSTPEKKTEADSKPETKMSGSTSTPTHQAREHRGIGNLVDAARRTRKQDSPPKKSSSEGVKKNPASKPAAKTPKKSAGRTSGGSGKTPSSKRKPGKKS